MPERNSGMASGQPDTILINSCPALSRSSLNRSQTTIFSGFTPACWSRSQIASTSATLTQGIDPVIATGPQLAPGIPGGPNLTQSGFMPGMDIRAELTVVGDGPVGAVGRQLDEPQYQPLPTVAVRIVSVLENAMTNEGQISYLKAYHRLGGWFPREGKDPAGFR